MAFGLGLSTPYYSTSFVAILAATEHYYAHLKQYVANIRGVTISAYDNIDDDLLQIRQHNARRAEDGDRTQPLPDREPEQQINRPLVPYIVFSPNVFDTILKNVVPEDKFEAYYTDLDGQRRGVKTRAVQLGMRCKTYVTNWAQALVIAEYMLAATPNTMAYEYPLFNLPNAQPESKLAQGNMTIAPPIITRAYKRETDGQLYVVSQDIALRFTIAVLPPGNQNDNGTSAEEAEANVLKIVERFNLDYWDGMIKNPNHENWLTGIVITPDGDTPAAQPTAREVTP